MSQAVEDPCDPPSDQTLARVAWAMALARDLAATPTVGGGRVRRLLDAMRDGFHASAASARLELADDPATTPLATLDWGDAAMRARARHQVGGHAGDLLADVLRLDARRAVRLELFRAEGPAFTAGDAAWLAAVHAGCAGIYQQAPPALRAAEALSPRDRETLDHLLRGESEKEIAARIGRSPHTVHTRVKRIYQRLGVGSRAELLARCLGGRPGAG